MYIVRNTATSNVHIHPPFWLFKITKKVPWALGNINSINRQPHLVTSIWKVLCHPSPFGSNRFCRCLEPVQNRRPKMIRYLCCQGLFLGFSQGKMKCYKHTHNSNRQRHTRTQTHTHTHARARARTKQGEPFMSPWLWLHYSVEKKPNSFEPPNRDEQSEDPLNICSPLLLEQPFAAAARASTAEKREKNWQLKRSVPPLAETNDKVDQNSQKPPERSQKRPKKVPTGVALRMAFK